MKKLLLITMIALLASCTDKEIYQKGKRQLEQMGYTDINNTGYSMFCCSKDDIYSMGFSCKDKQGYTVKGCFCSAYGQSVTIRFE